MLRTSSCPGRLLDTSLILWGFLCAPLQAVVSHDEPLGCAAGFTHRFLTPAGRELRSHWLDVEAEAATHGFDGTQYRERLQGQHLVATSNPDEAQLASAYAAAFFMVPRLELMSSLPGAEKWELNLVDLLEANSGKLQCTVFLSPGAGSLPQERLLYAQKLRRLLHQYPQLFLIVFSTDQNLVELLNAPPLTSR